MTIVIFDKAAYKISEKLFSDIAEYIDDNYVDEHTDYSRERIPMNASMPPMAARRTRRKKTDVDLSEMCDCKAMLAEDDLDAKLKQIDESFSQMLLRKIDEKGMTDAECYKKANIDRKLFSKIRSDVHYKPSKPTALAFAISLELSLAETEDMLRKAGFALSHSNKFDKCTTCQKAKKWLDDNKIEYEIRDIKLDNPTLDELSEWYKKSGLPLKKFFNTSGLLYKSLDLKNKLPTMSDDEMLKLLASDGMLVKRPLLIGDDFVLVGFKEIEWEKINNA